MCPKCLPRNVFGIEEDRLENTLLLYLYNPLPSYLISTFSIPVRVQRPERLQLQLNKLDILHLLELGTYEDYYVTVLTNFRSEPLTLVEIPATV